MIQIPSFLSPAHPDHTHFRATTPSLVAISTGLMVFAASAATGATVVIAPATLPPTIDADTSLVISNGSTSVGEGRIENEGVIGFELGAGDATLQVGVNVRIPDLFLNGDGELALNQDAVISDATGEGTLSSSGTISMTQVAGDSSTTGVIDVDLTNNGLVEVRSGTLRIDGDLINNEVVVVEGGTLDLNGDVSNRNKVEVKSGGDLSFSTVFSQSSEGVVEAEDGTTLVLDTTILQGTLRSLGSVNLTTASGSLEDVTTEGSFVIGNGETLTTTGRIENDGIIGFGLGDGDAILRIGRSSLASDLFLLGDGELALNQDAVIEDTTGDGTLTSGGTISMTQVVGDSSTTGIIGIDLINTGRVEVRSGTLRIDGEFTNAETVVIEGGTLDLTGGTLNRKMVEVGSGGALSFGATFSQSSDGVVQAEDGAILALDTTIFGGTLRSLGEVTLTTASGSLEDVTTEGTFIVGNGEILTTTGRIENDGIIGFGLGDGDATLRVGQNARAPDLFLTGGGELALNQDAVVADTTGGGTLSSTGIISMTQIEGDSSTTGIIETDLVNNGLLDVRSGALRIEGDVSGNGEIAVKGGSLDIDGSLSNSGGFELVLGPSPVTVSGSVFLRGPLDLVFDPARFDIEAFPEQGDTFDLITSDVGINLSGDFSITTFATPEGAVLFGALSTPATPTASDDLVILPDGLISVVLADGGRVLRAEIVGDLRAPVAPVPVPGAGLLLLSGLGALALSGLRSRSTGKV